ncbi:MAG: tetratricopeptide repeat protein [Proteobacteria bacterium]|nr:tetratricopeptide repeat protein [Pseudomonadota bacterium]
MSTIRPRYLAILAVCLSAAAWGQETDDPEDVGGLLDRTVPIADEETGLDAAGDATGTEESGPTTREAVLSEFERFREYLAERNYDEADLSAKRVVRMSIELYGPQSRETAKALNNLAIVQHSNKQYDAAVQNFESAIEILEIVEDRLNEQLVNPLKGLGAAQLGQGRPDLASRSFNRATHITHVNEGPHNIQQVEILESLAEANVRLGNVESARDVLDRIHILNVRHFENDALGLLPSLMRRASWQHRAGYYNDERATYRRAVRIIEESAGKNDPRLVDPLIRLGQSFYHAQPLADGYTRPVTASGELYLKRAVRIAERDDQFPWLELATAKLALADFYAVSEQHNRARRLYKEVWEALSTDEDRIEMREEIMGDPVPVWEEPLPGYTNAAGASQQATDVKAGNIIVNYTVSSRGRVRVIKTEADPIEFTDMQRAVHREIRRRVFRPQILDGVPVESDNQRFRHEFFYRQSELDDVREEQAAGVKEPKRT